MGTVLYGESAFRKIATSLLHYARANREFRDELRRALSGVEQPDASLPSLCEAFAAVLYHGNRRAAKEGFPSGNHPEEATIPEEVWSRSNPVPPWEWRDRQSDSSGGPGETSVEDRDCAHFDTQPEA